MTVNILERIDERILELFTKFSHRFQRQTGRTNFFLAKVANAILLVVAVITLQKLIETLSIPLNQFVYVILIFSHLFQVFFLFIALLMGSLCFLGEYIESRKKSNENTANPNKLVIKETRLSSLRVICYIPVMIFLAYSLETHLTPGTSVYKFLISIYFQELLALVCVYLLSINPLPPGKSKVRQWVDNFQAGFQKRQPLSSGGR